MKENAIGHLVKTNPIKANLSQLKPISNPIKPNLQKAKMNVNLTLTKDYRKKEDFVVRINKPNLVRRRRIAKMNINAFLQKDYENEPPSGPKKQTQFKACPERSRMGQFQYKKAGQKKIW